MDEELDFHPNSGSGSKEDAQKDHSHPTDERARGDVGSTTFDPNDASRDRQERFNDLRKRHHEHWNKSGAEKNGTDIAYDARMVCNQLELTEYQESRAIKLIDECRTQGLQYEKTIMGCVTYVLNEDERWIQRGDGGVGDDLHRTWCELLESFGITESSVKVICRAIQDSE